MRRGSSPSWSPWHRRAIGARIAVSAALALLLAACTAADDAPNDSPGELAALCDATTAMTTLIAERGVSSERPDRDAATNLRAATERLRSAGEPIDDPQLRTAVETAVGFWIAVADGQPPDIDAQRDHGDPTSLPKTAEELQEAVDPDDGLMYLSIQCSPAGPLGSS